MITFEQFRDTIFRMVEFVGQDFDKPYDDWIPMVFSLDGADRFDNWSPQKYFDSVESKEFFARVALPVMFKLNEVRMAALLLSAWTVMIDASGDEQRARQEANELSRQGLGNHPNRKEILILQVATVERHEDWWALIQRQENGPPLLSPWQPKPELSEAEGRMVDVVLRALQMAATLPARAV